MEALFAFPRRFRLLISGVWLKPKPVNKTP
jgi:hypothetical protein